MEYENKKLEEIVDMMFEISDLAVYALFERMRYLPGDEQGGPSE